MAKKKDKKQIEHYARNHGSALIPNPGNISTRPSVPNKWDTKFIEKQFEKVVNNPSAIDAYFQSLRAKFHGKAQLNFLNRLVEINNAIASGMATEVKMTKLKQQLETAKKELWIIMQDQDEATEELKIKQLERKMELEERQFNLEERQVKLARRRKKLYEDEADEADTKDLKKDADFDYFSDNE